MMNRGPEKKAPAASTERLPNIRSLSAIRREVQEHTAKIIRECSDRDSFEYEKLMHTLSHFESEQLQARKGSQVPKMIGLTAQQTLRHKPHVRLARILDRAEAEKARQEEAIRRRNDAVTAQARRRILSTSLTRAVKAKRTDALNKWLHDTLSTNASARRLRWLVILRLSQISSALSQAMCSKRKRIKARKRFQAAAALSSNALQAAKRAKFRIATNLVIDFLIFIQKNSIHFGWKETRKRTRRSVILMQKMFREKLRCREAHRILLSLQLRRAVGPALAARMNAALEDHDKRAQAELGSVSIIEPGEEDIKEWLRRRTKEHRVSYLQWQRFTQSPQQHAVAGTGPDLLDGERGEVPRHAAPPKPPRLMGGIELNKLAHKAISRALLEHRTATSAMQASGVMPMVVP